MSIVALSMALAAAAPSPAVPPAPALAVVSQVETGGGALRVSVILAGGPAPDTLDALLHGGDRDVPVTLVREGPPFTLAPDAWRRTVYTVARPEGLTGETVLSLSGTHDGYAFTLGAASGQAQLAQAVSRPPANPPAEPANPPPPPRIGNGFLPNLSAYNPIYAVTGHGTDTNTRLQLSFKYQLLGSPNDGNWYSGFHLAYTQRMFWDTAANSAPFRDVNYQPEFLYFYTLPKNEAGDQLGVRGGFLHESNGRDGASSRSYNIVYLQPTLDVPIGGWTASIGPRIFHYVGSRDGNEDIARYRGHQALAFSIAQPDGFKLSTWSRVNFSTGKGSVDADLSYPLTHIWHDLPLYVVVQGFTGYGEDLLDYDRKQTRLRVGIGIVR